MITRYVVDESGALVRVEVSRIQKQTSASPCRHQGPTSASFRTKNGISIDYLDICFGRLGLLYGVKREGWPPKFMCYGQIAVMMLGNIG